MRVNKVKQLLQGGHKVLGALVGFNSPAFVEFCALADLHFVMFDCEHGAMSIESVENLVRAAESAGITPLARVPHNEPSTILRFLDTGVMGVMVPHIETAADAQAVVRAVKYPPIGDRGLGSVRSADYLARGGLVDYVNTANDETLVIALIESRRGVENAAEIASVPGVDVVQLGPNDLSMSLGRYGQQQHPEVQGAIDTVIAATLAAGKYSGSGAIRGADALRAAYQRGIRFVTYGARDLVIDSGKQLLTETA